MMITFCICLAQSLLALIQQELATLAKDYALAVLVTSQSSDDGKGVFVNRTSAIHFVILMK